MGELQQHSSPAHLPPPPPSDETTPSPSAPRGDSNPPPSQSPPPTPPRFDPSRMIGIIRRKALIKDLAAVYHAECLAYCQELLELQRICEECTGLISSRWGLVRTKTGLHAADMKEIEHTLDTKRTYPRAFTQELAFPLKPYIDTKATEDSRKETVRVPKRLKKSR